MKLNKFFLGLNLKRLKEGTIVFVSNLYTDVSNNGGLGYRQSLYGEIIFKDKETNKWLVTFPSIGRSTWLKRKEFTLPTEAEAILYGPFKV